MISVFELFKIGVGPSSSHTVGPMKAALAFAEGLPTERVARVRATLLGSLAFTGKGHATDRAVLLGLAGEAPDTLDAERADALIADASTPACAAAGGPAGDPVRSVGRYRVRLRHLAAAPSQYDEVRGVRRLGRNRRRRRPGCRSAAGSFCARARRATWRGRGAPIPIRSATRSTFSTRPRRRA